MSTVKVLKKFNEHIVKLEAQKKVIEEKRVQRMNSNHFARFFFSIKDMFHDDVTIKEQKINALKDIQGKLQDRSLNANNYYPYIFLRYQVKRNAVFFGLFNRTEKLIDKAGKSLADEKLQQSNLGKKNFYHL